MCSNIKAHNQYNQGCAVTSRHIISKIEGVQQKRVDYQVLVQRGTSKKYFSMNESLLLLIYQVKMVSSLWQAVKIDQSISQLINQSENIERNL